MTDNEPTSDATDTDRDQLTKTNSLTYPINEKSPSDAIVRAVSTLTGREILDLDPLYHVIDPDHVDGFFENLTGDVGNTEISFEFNNSQVTVTHEEIYVEEMTESS